MTQLLLVILDDVGLDCMPYFEPATDTPQGGMPNTLALMNDGRLFSNAWGAPVCSPCRSIIETGMLMSQTLVIDGIQLGSSYEMASTFQTLAKVLKQNKGVKCGYFGKQHLSLSTDYVINDLQYDIFKGLMGNLNAPSEQYDDWPYTQHTAGGSPTTTPDTATYMTTKNVDDFLAWKSGLVSGAPWFAVLAMNTTHSPYHRPPLSLHSYTTAQLPNDNPVGGEPKRPYLLAACEAWDTEFGRLMASLNDDVVVIYTSDNGNPDQVIGPPWGDTLNHDKDTVYQGGIRVPLIIRAKTYTDGRDIAGAWVPQAVSLADIYSTIMDFFGIKVQGLYSRSLVPVLVEDREWIGGPRRSLGRSHTFTEQATPNSNPPVYTSRQSAAITSDARWKLVNNDGVEELYDVSEDINEESPISLSDPNVATILAGLRGAITEGRAG